MTMYYSIGALLFSMLMSYFILPNILFISHSKQLFDKPDDRKNHIELVPRLGGTAFFPVIFITILGFIILCIHRQEDHLTSLENIIHKQLSALSLGGILLYLVGIKDDLVGVCYKSKFIVQILSGLLLSMSGLWIESFGGISFLSEIPPFIGVPVSVFICVYITNSINLIDGIDGLASGLASIALLTMGILFLISGEIIYAILAFSSVGCLIPFFWTNVRRSHGSRKKLFMGDTGSLTLGYLLSFLFLSLCVNTSTFQPLELRYQYIAFGALVIPLFDVVRVVLIRVRHGQPPFLPDRNHIHHKLMRAGLSDTQTMVSLLSLSIFFIISNYTLTNYLYGSLVFFIDVVIWLLFHGLLNLHIKMRIQKQG